jgi:hypothetical protein
MSAVQVADIESLLNPSTRRKLMDDAFAPGPMFRSESSPATSSLWPDAYPSCWKPVAPASESLLDPLWRRSPTMRFMARTAASSTVVRDTVWLSILLLWRKAAKARPATIVRIADAVITSMSENPSCRPPRAFMVCIRTSTTGYCCR